MEPTMKLPSIRQAYQEARSTAVRFPVVICDAAITTVAALIIVDHEGPAEPTILFNIFFAGVLGIPLLIVLALVAERRGLRIPAHLALQLLGLLLIAGYAFTIPTDFMHAPLVSLIRFFILGVALLLLVSVAPYTARGERNGFWHFNKTLFLRILTALLYALVLYAGLSIALAALDNLFGVNVPGKRYFELWILITGLFTTWFFLAGIPAHLSVLDGLTEYPRSLKVLAQYILLPIVLIYLVILYAYLGKIVVAWDWPQGWVSKLILGFSGTGMFLLLLLHPVMEHANNVWITKFSKWFYLVLIPLIPMLFLAVWRRVGEYGMTEGRYLALALGIWLVFIVIYYSFSETKSIKVIPASLCLLAFAVSFGPWGAFSVSRQSQIGRLERLATEAGILVDSKIRTVHAETPFNQAKQISAILAYLHEIHGFDGIQGWFPESLKDDTSSSGLPYKSPEAVGKMMGIQFVTYWAASPEGMVNFNAEGSFDPRGFERMTIIQMFRASGREVRLPTDSISYRISTERDSMIISAIPTGVALVRINLLEHAKELLEKYRSAPTDHIPDDEMIVNATGNGLRVRICPTWMQIQEQNGKTKLTGMTAVMLYSLEKPGGNAGQAGDPSADSKR
jgi:hypothetical protein